MLAAEIGEVSNLLANIARMFYSDLSPIGKVHAGRPIPFGKCGFTLQNARRKTIHAQGVVAALGGLGDTLFQVFISAA